jgi:hypothetical protein
MSIPSIRIALLSLLSTGCLHHGSPVWLADLSTPEIDVYVSSSTFPDGRLREQIIERVGPIEDGCERVEIDFLEYAHSGHLEAARTERRMCGAVVAAVRWDCDESGRCNPLSMTIDIDRDGWEDYSFSTEMFPNPAVQWAKLAE